MSLLLKWKVVLQLIASTVAKIIVLLFDKQKMIDLISLQLKYDKYLEITDIFLYNININIGCNKSKIQLSLANKFISTK